MSNLFLQRLHASGITDARVEEGDGDFTMIHLVSVASGDPISPPRRVA